MRFALPGQMHDKSPENNPAANTYRVSNLFSHATSFGSSV